MMHIDGCQSVLYVLSEVQQPDCWRYKTASQSLRQAQGNISQDKARRNYLFVCQFFLGRSEFFCILGEYDSGWDYSE